MKAFRFGLDRVLAWRGTELTLAESKAERLKGGLRSIEEAMVRLVAARSATQASVGRSARVSGAELAVLERARVWSVREEQRLAVRRLELRHSLEIQNCCVAAARRGVKLVERLKERKLVSWEAEAEHELDELAGESAIAQWRRLHS